MSERGESRGDPRSHAVHLAQQRVGTVVAKGPRDALDHRRVARDAVRLLARRELDAVLEPAQEEVRVRELALLALGHEAARPEPPQGVDRVRAAHARIAAAPDELQALGEELDLPDAARPDLQVVARADARLGSTPGEHGAHLVDEARVDRAPPHERRQRAEQLGAEGRVARHRPGPHEGGALPRPAPRLVVALRGRERVHQRSARPLGPEPQVDPPGDAVLRRLVERRDHPLRDPREVLVQRVRAGRRGPRDDEAVVGLVEEHQVDVAARVELATAELAHADHGERARRPVRGDRRPEAGLGPRLRLGERDLAADVGQVRELARGDVDVVARVREELARRDPQLLAGRPAAQPAPDARAVREIADGRGGEAPVGAQVPGLPRPARQRQQGLGVRVDEGSERRVAADEQGPELDEVPPHAVARPGDERGDAGAGGRGFAGGDVLGAHRAPSLVKVAHARCLNCGRKVRRWAGHHGRVQCRATVASRSSRSSGFLR